ncbi:MAG: serine hydrolase domain-containing protein [Burkholderiales bacterium]
MNRVLSGTAAFLVLASAAGLVSAAPDEEKLGKSEGYPLCLLTSLAPPDEKCLVGMLSHFDTLVPARNVAKGSSVFELKRPAGERKITYSYQNRSGDTDSYQEHARNTGLLVLKGDTIAVERYQYDRKPSDRMQSYSMAKTVVAMLVGIAIADKKIRSIEDTAEQYIPELKGHPYGETRLRDLLTMSSGVRFSENYDGRDDISVLARKTIYQLGPGGVDSVLSFTERANPPGTKFYYASAETQVLGLVLRAATGVTLAEYLSAKIWRPMGAESDASWLVDAGGYELGYIGINATVRDWGRLGLLLANYGNLNGKQIIPAEWVKAATAVHSPHLAVGTATPRNGYGYQTWLIDNDGRFALLGLRGQGVFVDPKSKVVVVITAVHALPRDPARGEQFGYFFGAVRSLSD